MNEHKLLILRMSHPFIAGIISLAIVFILHLVGISTQRWSTAFMPEIKLNTTKLSEQVYQAGLWDHCACSVKHGFDVCVCIKRKVELGWFVSTQVFAIIALVTLLASCVLSVSALFLSQQKRIRIANTILICCSGIFITIVVITYGVEANDHIDDGFNMILHLIKKAKFGFSFILCCVSSVLCLLVTLPLFLIDVWELLRSPSEEITAVQYTTQT